LIALRIILLGFVIAIAVLTISTCPAHDLEHPELNGWLESLHSGKGPCCDGSDAKRLDNTEWDTKDGHYRVFIDGEWVEVPDEAVIGAPNRANRAMVWPQYQDGHPKVRCFIAGAEI
jgi:hypothetical protein